MIYKEMYYVLGIDPGLSGGLAFMASDALKTDPKVFRMPRYIDENLIDFDALLELLTRYRPRVAYLERPFALPGELACHGLTTGVNWGLVYGALKAAHIPVVCLPSVTWHKALTKSFYGEDPKARARAFVAANFPGANTLATPRSKVPHQGLVDALCIGEYGIRMERGDTGFLYIAPVKKKKRKVKKDVRSVTPEKGKPEDKGPRRGQQLFIRKAHQGS